MSDLRLGAIHLEPRDVAYVRALVRLFAHTEKLSWSFADFPPFHAVVANPAAPTANPGFFSGFDGPVLTLIDGVGTPALDTVGYPIRANQFRDWLKLRQDTLLERLYRAETVAPVVPAAAMAAAATGAPAPAAIKTVASVAGRRFKLRRWPAAQLLQGDAFAVRMSTLMSRNALTTSQLAGLTGQAEDRCRAFVAQLQEAGLLTELVALGSQADAIPTPAAADPVVVAPARTGLMASLRRHLGL